MLALAMAPLARFPLALLAAAAGSVLAAWPSFPKPAPWLLTLAAIFLWSVAVRLAVEARAPVPAIRLGAPWLPGLLIVLPLTPAVALAPHMLILALAGALAIIAVPLAIPAGRDTTPQARVQAMAWAVGVAGLAALVVAIGLSLLLAGTDALFATTVFHRSYSWLWSISGLLLLPGLALAFFPQADAQASPFPRWLMALSDWLLVPLTLAYAALLNVYCLYILARWELPKGVVAAMVIAFAILGGLIWTTAGGDSPRQANLLRRAFLPSLLAPALAMAVAAWIRIGEYGITEQRYMLLLAAGAFVVLAATQLARRRVPRPASAALLLSALLLVASFGPWSATSVSLASQTQRLHGILTRVGHLQDGKVVRAGPPVADTDSHAITSAVDFLVEHGAEAAIAAWMELPPPGASSRSEQIVTAMGAAHLPYWRASQTPRTIRWAFRRPLMTSVMGYDWLIATTIWADKPQRDGAGEVQFTLDGEAKRLVAHFSDNSQIAFDLGAALTADSATTADAAGAPVLVPASDGKPARLYIDNASANLSASGQHRLTSISFRMLLGKPGTAPR